jgi:ATP-dependent DNA helicase PIF1
MRAPLARSRATSLDGLQVIGFNDKKVLAHPKVVAWTKTLTTLD